LDWAEASRQRSLAVTSSTAQSRSRPVTSPPAQQPLRVFVS